MNTNDTVYLKSEKEEFILGSHDLIFKLKHESFQEVFGHKEGKERIGRSDKAYYLMLIQFLFYYTILIKLKFSLTVAYWSGRIGKFMNFNLNCL